MVPDSQTRSRKSEETRQKLLQAAEEIFIQQGFDAARVDEIADRTGYNKRMIYIHFGSKKGLYFEVLKENFSKILKVHQSILRETDDPYEQVVKLIRRHFNFLIENQGFVRLLEWQNLMNHCSREENQELTDMLADGLHEMEKILERGVRKGILRSDLEVKHLLLSVSGLCLSYAQERLLRRALGGKPISDPKYREEALCHITKIVMEGIIARPKS